MPEKKSAVDVLSILVERVRRIERESGQVAAVIDSMIASINRQKAENKP